MKSIEQKVAEALWHRFAPVGHIDWEDETHKAEYLDAAVQVIHIVQTATSTSGNRGGNDGQS